MPNYIKYTTGTESKALKKGNFYIGTGDEDKGPTSQTGFYNGPTPGDYQYTVYVNQDNDIPLAYTARNDNELVTLTNTISGQSFTTINQCFAYYEGQNDKMCINKPIDGIVTDGLVLNLDAGNVISYPASGSTWEDISGNNNSGSLVNGPTFDSGNGGSIVFDGTDDGVNTNFNSSLNDFTVCAWFRGTNQGNTRRIVDKNYQTGFWLGYNGGNHPSSSYWGGGIRQESAPYGIYIGPFSTNTWNFISMRRQGTIQTLYANGVDNSISQSVTSDSLSNNVLTVGSGGSRYMSGSISIVQIYNRALTSEEILQNYNATKARFEAIEPVTNGLVLNLDAGNPNSYLDGVSGTTWSDVSGEGNDGTLINGTAFTSSDGGAMVFDGADDYVDCGNSSTVNLNSSFTINCWVKISPTAPSSSGKGIVGKYTGYTDNRSYLLFYDGINNLVTFAISTDGTNTPSTFKSINSSTLSKDVWYNITTTFRASSSLEIYINGTLNSSDTTSFSTIYSSSNQPLTIGAQAINLGGFNLQGNIANTQIYNRALSADEISQNFNALRGRYGI